MNELSHVPELDEWVIEEHLWSHKEMSQGNIHQDLGEKASRLSLHVTFRNPPCIRWCIACSFPMVFRSWHCTPVTLGLLSPVLCARVLVRMALVSFWLVSRLVFPFAFMLLWDLPHMYAFRLVSLQLLYPHVFRIQCLFLLFSPWLPLHIYKTRKACMFRQFIYRLRSVVSLLLVLDLSLPRYSTSSILWKLLDSQSAWLSTCTNLEDYFRGTLDSATFLRPLGSAYTCIQLEIPGPRQKASTAHELKPLSRHPSTPESQDPTYVLGSLGLDW